MFTHFWNNSKTVVRRCSAKKVFLKISRYSQESISAGVTVLWNLQGFRLPIIKNTPTMVFPYGFCKVLETPSFRIYTINKSVNYLSSWTFSAPVLKTYSNDKKFHIWSFFYYIVHGTIIQTGITSKKIPL